MGGRIVTDIENRLSRDTGNIFGDIRGVPETVARQLNATNPGGLAPVSMPSEASTDHIFTLSQPSAGMDAGDRASMQAELNRVGELFGRAGGPVIALSLAERGPFLISTARALVPPANGSNDWTLAEVHRDAQRSPILNDQSLAAITANMVKDTKAFLDTTGNLATKYQSYAGQKLSGGEPPTGSPPATPPASPPGSFLDGIAAHTGMQIKLNGSPVPAATPAAATPVATPPQSKALPPAENGMLDADDRPRGTIIIRPINGPQ